MAKQNIIILLNSFWNNGKGMSGGDQMLIQIFKRIRSDFNKIYCITNFDGKIVIENDLKNIDFLLSSTVFDKLNLLINYFFRTIQAFRILKLKNIDIIYSGSDFFPDVLPAYIYTKLNPSTKWYQCIFHIYPNYKVRPGSKIKSFVAEYLQKFSFFFAKNADCIININTQVSQKLIQIGFEKEKIVVNTPGINFNYLSDIKYDADTPYYDATFLARLNPSKGIFDLINIWKLVLSKVPNARLGIIGGGSKKIIEELTIQIKENSLENNISLLGFIENQQSFEIIKKSKVFIFPSHEEGFGIAIADAMACSVPVISWDLEVYDEIFEDNLVQIPLDDIDGFANKIVSTLEQANKDIVEKAYKFIGKYDWEQISIKHKNILKGYSNG